MNLKNLKLEFFHIRKAFLVYGHGWAYLYYRYIVAPKIFRLKTPLDRPINYSDLSVHILTCHRDLLMFIWSLASFYRHGEMIGQVVVHNDGSLTAADQRLIKRLFPSVAIYQTSDFLKDYQSNFNNYQILNDFRANYKKFSFKKLIDPYFVSTKSFRLVIDSDLFWFGPPIIIKQALDSSDDKSLMQQNNIPIYVSFKDGSRVADYLAQANSGIVFYRQESFDLEKLAEFLTKLDTKVEKNLYFADQLGYAYSLKNLSFLPPEIYPIKSPWTNEISIKHYTGPRRSLFYVEGVKRLAKEILNIK
ncbi:MAG: hypothetical protein RB292_02325 [Patescibacteria group bacterium]|jgi:hypothetical protein|nr:hypothetical protein [Patescibacteria group bacterium]